MKRYLIPLIVILVLSSALSLGCEQTSRTVTTRTYISETYGYSFLYPSDWFIDVEDEASLRIANSDRETYLTMIITPVPSTTGAATPQDILKLYVDNAKSSDAVYYEEYHLKTEKQLMRAYPACEVIYTHKGKGKQFTWQTRNLIAYSNGRIYDFACSAQETKYDQYFQILDDVFNSLKLF